MKIYSLLGKILRTVFAVVLFLSAILSVYNFVSPTKFSALVKKVEGGVHIKGEQLRFNFAYTNEIVVIELKA